MKKYQQEYNTPYQLKFPIEIEKIIEYEVNKLSQTKIEYEEVFRWLERTNTRFETVIEKLEPEMSDKELEAQEGYCILLKDNK